MYGFGQMEQLIPIIIVVAIIVMIFFARQSGMRSTGAGPKLVLRKFNIDEDSPANLFVDISGRASGAVDWFLTVIGFDAETSLKVTDKDVTFRSSSLFGQTYHMAPLPNVSSTYCGYLKPIGFLIFGALIVIGGIVGGITSPGDGGWIVLFGLLIGGGCLLAYYLSRTIVISVETSGGSLMRLAFKRSVIENMSVDMETTLKAIRLINQKTVDSQTK
jgi:hypothetical protein